jgi:hypothetical protein
MTGSGSVQHFLHGTTFLQVSPKTNLGSLFTSTGTLKIVITWSLDCHNSMAPRPGRSYIRPEEAVVHIKVRIEKVKSLPSLPCNLSCTCDTSKLQMPAKQRANLAVQQRTTHACRGRGRATYDNLVDLAGRAGLVFGTDSGLSPVAVPLARVKRLYLRHRQAHRHMLSKATSVL